MVVVGATEQSMFKNVLWACLSRARSSAGLDGVKKSAMELGPESVRRERKPKLLRILLGGGVMRRLRAKVVPRFGSNSLRPERINSSKSLYV